MRNNVTGERISEVLYCPAKGTPALPRPPHTGAVSSILVPACWICAKLTFALASLTSSLNPPVIFVMFPSYFYIYVYIYILK